MKTIEDYCEKYLLKYEHWVREFSFKFLNSWSFISIFFCTTLIISTLKFAYIGIDGFWAFLPAQIMFLGFLASRKIYSKPHVIIRYSIIIYDFIALLLALGSAFFIAKHVEQDQTLYNAPIQVTLFLLCSLSFRPHLASNIMRNVTITLIYTIFCYRLFPNFLGESIIQVPSGLLPAIAINYFFVLTVKTMYYVTSSSTEKRIHAYNQLTKVVYPHQLEQIEHGHQLEQTMPLGKHQAIIITFDIVASSKIQFPFFENARRSFLKKAEQIMMIAYDPYKLQSNAYLLKELGDGFICSVGFPFAAPGQSTIYTTAEAICQQFAALFQSEIRDYAENNVHCAMGMGFGEIQGYYTKGEIKQYELSGTPIIQATRYESLRKQLFFHDPKKFSTLIIPASIYKNLPPQNQELYYLWDLKKSNIAIRDDEQATHVYVQNLYDSNGLSILENSFANYLEMESKKESKKTIKESPLASNLKASS